MKLWPFKLWPFLGYPTMPPTDEAASTPEPTPVPEPPKPQSFGKLVLADLLRHPASEWQFEYSKAQGSTYQLVTHPKVPYKLFTNFADSDRSYVSVLELEGDPFGEMERYEIFRTLKRIRQIQWDNEDERKKADDAVKIKQWYPNAKV
jgi:hypothetical protein